MEEKRNYIEGLFPRIKDIRDPKLRNKVVDTWIKAWEMSGWDKIEEVSAWPPEKGKLQLTNVDHTNQVVECVLAVAKVVDKVQQIEINVDYLIAAAILHDIDKMLLFNGVTDELTPHGKLLPHISLSIFLALEQGLPLEVVHAIVSHSPNYSTISPKTHEALILAQVDMMMMSNWIMSKKVDISFKIEGERGGDHGR